MKAQPARGKRCKVVQWATHGWQHRERRRWHATHCSREPRARQFAVPRQPCLRVFEGGRGVREGFCHSVSAGNQINDAGPRHTGHATSGKVEAASEGVGSLEHTTGWMVTCCTPPVPCQADVAARRHPAATRHCAPVVAAVSGRGGSGWWAAGVAGPLEGLRGRFLRGGSVSCNSQ